MCGISGFNWKDGNKIREMSRRISYRGPDAEGVFVEDGVSLGHNRLSVIDLSKEANQPMKDNSGELVIIFNGEIYNFKGLRSELEKEYKFRTKSDTEVILAGYRKWGKGILKKMNGMFAFVIWNRRDQSLFCARDHMGMKPFYYFWNGKQFIFASEISAILTHNIPKKINIDSLNHYFRILYVPEPLTLIKDVFKLPPCHSLFLKGGKIEIESYAEEKNKSFLSYGEAKNELKRLVFDATERHLISDVPLGIYLSGGIDSSIVLASTSKIRGDVDTFSIGFSLKNKQEETKFNYDMALARKTAKHFKTRHHEVVVSTEDAVRTFDEMVAHNSDPISNPTSIAMMLLARFAKSKVTVALTGNAGDELFGGYERYKKALLTSFIFSPTDLFEKFMFQKDRVLGKAIKGDYIQPTSKVREYYKKYLIDSSTVDALMNADRQSWLPEHFFMLSDKMSMSSALEERMPLADKEVVNFAESLPRKYKVNLGETKKILRDAFENELPGYLFDQPKRGWFSPAAKWFREPIFTNLAAEILSESYYEETRCIFDWPEVQNMLNKHISKEEYNLTILWAILTFQAWAKQYRIEI